MMRSAEEKLSVVDGGIGEAGLRDGGIGERRLLSLAERGHSVRTWYNHMHHHAPRGGVRGMISAACLPREKIKLKCGFEVGCEM
jgi:hypothetical protein